MERLTNPVQRYAWGSHTAIPSLLGVAPDGQPQAELWVGAHASAPSRLSTGVTLDAHCTHEAARVLGNAVLTRFGPQLPFLMKVLAAAQPLSLQAHPTLPQAQAGFAREEAAGLPRTDPTRSYRDANHKPEIICALTPFTALCGFRRHEDSLRLFRGLELDVGELEKGLRPFFQHVMSLPRDAAAAMVDALLAGAHRGVPDFGAECALALRLGELYPGDAGVVGALLLNRVELQPGEALYLGAGNLHAYLEGTGVELMASSDNVLRGGLTPKHVDVPELLRVLDFTDGPPRILRPVGTPEGVYDTPAPDFRLSRLTLEGQPFALPAGAPQLLLVTAGTVEVGAEQLAPGEAVFVGADEAVTLSGRGTVFRATTNL